MPVSTNTQAQASGISDGLRQVSPGVPAATEVDTGSGSFLSPTSRDGFTGNGRGCSMLKLSYRNTGIDVDDAW